MNIGVVKESVAGERRVALTPPSVKRLTGSHSVLVEAGAGVGAGIGDDDYRVVGAEVTSHAGALAADLVVGVNGPPDLSRQGALLLGLIRPFEQPDLIRELRRVGGERSGL